MKITNYQGEKFKIWLDKLLKKEKSKPKDERLTVGKIQKMLGLSVTSYYSLFNSKNLTRESVNRITKTFGVSEEEIWGTGTSNAKPAKFKGNGDPNMWIVPIKVQGGFLSGYGDQVYMDNELDKVYFPFISQECFAFEIDGLSMITDYMPGEYFVGTLLESLDHLVKGRVYVFQTIDGIIVKEFVKIDDNHIHLRSQNEDYNPVKPIYLKEVKRVYQREMVIKN